MNCPKCQSEYQAGDKFCRECGTKLPSVCPQCGHEVSPKDKFCPECGAKLIETDSSKEDMKAFRLEDVQEKPRIPDALRKQMDDAAREMEGENRLVTSLFADISGFTPMSQELSPEAVVERVNQCFRVITDTIHRYEGRHNRFIGDCELAFFGAPLAHENDPERAILAALDMHKGVEELGLNISVGINTGMAYFGTIGTGENQEISAYGVDVNLAKRLQEKANPGQILVGDGTYRLTRTIFNFNSLGLNTFKGIKTPVLIYEVLGVKEHPEKLRGIEGLRARMIGREKEFTALIDCADALVAEHKGQIVTISGEAGIGKSRLVGELKEYLKDKEVQCLEGRCFSIGQTIGFWPFIDIIHTYLGISNENDIASDRLIMKMGSLFGQEAENIIPYIGQMLSIRLDEKYQQRIRYAAPDQIRHQILLRTRDFFLKLAQEKPLLLILEDMHWADELSLDLFYVLMDELPNAPILLVCVYRPERDHGSSKIDPVASSKYLDRYTRISIRALTQHETQQLLESLLAVDNLPPQIRAMVLDKTEGNPFFIEEVIRLLIDQGMIYRENDRWKAKEAISEISVPETIQSVILSRIDALQEAVRHVLQYASVIGRVFQRQLLCYIAGQEEAIEQKLSQLEADELVYKERIVPELEYAFKHALTQEATYHQLLNQQRRLFHERIGEGIEAIYREQIEEYYERLAYHYSRSDNKEKAIEYLVKAGQKAAYRYVNKEALSYFQQALDRVETGEDYNRILEHRAKLLLRLFRGEEAANDYQQLLEGAKQTGDRKQELESLLGLASAYYIIALDEPDFASKSLELYKQAYTIARTLGDKERMARSLIPTADFRDFWIEYTNQAFANIEEALAISRELGNEELIIDSMIARLKFRNFLGTKEQAEKQIEELLNLIEPRYDLIKLREAYFRIIWIYLTRSNFKKCIEYCDASIRLASETGAPPVQYQSIKAYALLNLGQYDSAWESLLMEVADENHQFAIAFRDFVMGIYFMELMNYEKASKIFESVIEQARHVERAWLVSWAQRNLARCFIRTGQLDRVNVDNTITADIVAEIALSDGKLDEALKQAEQARLQAEEGSNWWADQSDYTSVLELQLRVLLRLGRYKDVVTLADTGIRVSEGIGYLPMMWRIRSAKAQALKMLGNVSSAVQEYKAAAVVIRKLADTIKDEQLRQAFMSNTLISSIILEGE